MLRASGLLGLLGTVCVLACGDAAGPDTQDDSDKIVGAAPAKGTSLDAVGSLRYSSADDAGIVPAGPIPASFKTLCTATLIAPTLIVTAKHCATRTGEVTSAMSDRQTIFFATGPDATKPKKTSRVVKTWLSPIAEGGYVSYGSDVAVMQLEDSFADITPLKVADGHLYAGLDQARFSAVGYGYRDRAGKYGTRRAGTMTLQTTSGRFMKSVFTSKDAMVAFAKTEEPGGISADDEARLGDLWNRSLLDQYEVFTGLGYGDAQPCNGDSGAPLLARVGDELVVGGVVSGSHKLSDRSVNPCSVLGQIYATFGPSVQTTFDAAQALSNQPIARVTVTEVAAGSSEQLPPEVEAPAPDAGTLSDRCQGISTTGSCAGDVVERCIAPTEGPPRPVRIDCSLLLSTCAVNATTKAAECVDAPTQD